MVSNLKLSNINGGYKVTLALYADCVIYKLAQGSSPACVKLLDPGLGPTGRALLPFGCLQASGSKLNEASLPHHAPSTPIWYTENLPPGFSSFVTSAASCRFRGWKD